MQGSIGTHITYLGGAEELEIRCSNLHSNGIQLVADGFTWQDATVEARVKGSDAYEPVTINPNATISTVICKDFMVDEIKISGLDAGSYVIYAAHVSRS